MKSAQVPPGLLHRSYGPPGLWCHGCCKPSLVTHTLTLTHTHAHTHASSDQASSPLSSVFSRSGASAAAAHGAGLPPAAAFPSRPSVHSRCSHAPLSCKLTLRHRRKHNLAGSLLPVNTGRQPATGSHDSRRSARAPNLCRGACHSLAWDPALLQSSPVHNSKCVDPPQRVVESQRNTFPSSRSHDEWNK